ncbi:5-formyltetrahydrofolate cyclo-ligase [Cephus cinctus]|uniref:5-formyltetrahydrofolate cyclo-ligase n=1 Tax=Cephus cinctus TaxID=211228 RepID=A0AAJ7C2E9_CEPCN|nr:5-formyltetrahydrofolate cyclo-ligase [Cephus cinctus]XP_024944604.1 5-formyltetrahydrofolate cyclo-ligase [Cephus cinctus]XP_024944628.1 5-formyltetrahydrofolate cyclo-ligase [Cephus cinctus]
MRLSNLTMAAITTAKKVLRKEIETAIKGIDIEERKKQSRKVFEKLLSLEQYQKSKRISVYLSTADEIDTVPILKDIFENAKEAFVPRYKGKTMQMVKLNSMEDYEKLPLTKWNIKQPGINEVRDDALETGGLDLIILPGVAFTKDGKRLGHGMGYYDKFLATCISSQSAKPYLVAMAFNEQLRDDIPTTDTDVILNMILTEKDF